MISSTDTDVRPVNRKVLAVVAVLALLGAGLSGYMWYLSVELKAAGYTAGIPICPETDLISCKDVLLSRYAQWLGVPVAGAGFANYAALMVAAGLMATAGGGVRRALWTAALVLAAIGTLAGLWLLGVQLLIIQKVCYLCDVVHVCGMVCLVLLLRVRPAGAAGGVYALAGGLAGVSLGVLVAGQAMFEPEQKGHRVVVSRPAVSTMSASVGGAPQSESTPAAQTQPAGSQPANAFVIRDANGAEIATLDLDEEIVLGDPTAERTVIELMDFGCQECRHELELFQEIWKKHPRWFRLICLMYPANKKCNPHTEREKPHACESAEAALAVREHKPEVYTQTHLAFYRLQSTLTGNFAWQVAREMAQVDDATLRAWQQDGRWLEKIRRHCEIGVKLQQRPGLPTLYANGVSFSGGDETQAQLEKKLHALIGPPDGPASASAAGPASRAAGSVAQ